MNRYEIRVKNATIKSEGLDEYTAMKNVCIFANIGDMLAGFRTDEEIQMNFGWIYQVELNGETEIAYVKRIA